MAKTRDEVGDKVREAITRTLREKLGLHGFRDATVTAGPDHVGDPALFVIAHFDLVPEPLDLGITVGIIGDLRDALDDIGEDRFPYTTFDFHDNQKILEKKRRQRA